MELGIKTIRSFCFCFSLISIQLLLARCTPGFSDVLREVDSPIARARLVPFSVAGWPCFFPRLICVKIAARFLYLGYNATM